MATKGTVVVTGGSQGIGAAIVKEFLDRGYAVVATSRKISQAGLAPSANLALVDGDIASAATAEKVIQTAVSRFGSVDHVVNNAGIFIAKPFTEYTAEDFKALVSTNIEGFLYVTQFAVKQMLSQGTPGSVTNITTSLVQNPNSQLTSSVAMITKGAMATIIRSLSNEYASRNIRFNAVAPGYVDTPLTAGNPRDFMKGLSPMGVILDSKDIADAVVYVTEAKYVTGEVLHVDGGAHVGKW